MKNKNSRKKEYYIHQIVRENEPQKNENVKPVSTNVRNTPTYAENVGYHLDPSRYDSLRTYKPKQEVFEEEIEEVIDTEVVNNDPVEDYYSALADEYVEQTDETILNDIISEDDIEEPVVEEVVQEVKEEVITPSVKQTIPVTPTPKSKVVRKKKYIAPSLDLLNKGNGTTDKDVSLDEEQKAKINEILEKYGIKAHVAK